MKKLIFWIVLILNFSQLVAQDSSKVDDIIAFQKHMNAEFANPEESPLTLEDIKKFESLVFFRSILH
tara:strand:- start:523 stop:723 length:201 start_codon:yes stop_codon:yes gene_type:complete